MGSFTSQSPGASPDLGLGLEDSYLPVVGEDKRGSLAAQADLNLASEEFARELRRTFGIMRKALCSCGGGGSVQGECLNVVGLSCQNSIGA